MRRTVVALIGSMILAGSAAAAPPQATRSGPNAKAATTKTGDSAKIREAMSAAPADIGRGATIMDWPDAPGGQMKQLRAGTNGWMCMPSTGVAGGIGADPMCLDKVFSSWADAWMNKKDPSPAQTVGTAYMLRGDKGASNTDPFATGPSPTNQWVTSGPHVMVVVPNLAQLDAFPTDPHNGGPWVMWKGTKYAHLMMPVAAMPKSAAVKNTAATGAAKK